MFNVAVGGGGCCEESYWVRTKDLVQGVGMSSSLRKIWWSQSHAACSDLKLLLSCPAGQNPAPYSRPMYDMEMQWGHDMMQHVAQEQKLGQLVAMSQLLQKSTTVMGTCPLGWAEIYFVMYSHSKITYLSKHHPQYGSGSGDMTFHSRLHRHGALC